MKKIKISLSGLLIILSLFFSITLLAQEEFELEEAYIEVKSKNLKDDFFMVKYDFEKDEVFIPIKSLFYFLEIYSIDIDLNEKIIKYQVDEKITSLRIKKENCFEKDGDLYISLIGLENDLEFKNLRWSSQDLKLVFEPNFILPFEIREKGKVERLRLKDRKVEENFEVIKPLKKVIAPGLFKVNYNMASIENAESKLNLEYGTQFLYGDLYLNYNLEPKQSLETYNLTYNNIYKDNDFVIGDYYMKTPDFLNINSTVKGISFGEKNIYSSTIGNITTIKGEAQGADIIELYQSGLLLDYQRPTEKKFIFEVRDRNYGGEYSLKIYYKNGQIETRKVYTVGDLKLLNKNEWSYNIQFGQEKAENKKQSVNEISYGITNNLTIGAGVLRLNSQKNKEYNLLKNELLYKLVLSNNYPTMINFQNFYEYEEEQESFEVRIDQKIQSYNINLKYYNYSDYFAEENNVKEYKSISLSKDFLSTRIGIGYQEEMKKNEFSKEKGFYISLENRSLRNFSFFIDAELTKENDKEKSYSINPGISYSGINGYTMVFQTNIEKQKKIESDYTLKILGRRKPFFSTGMEYVLGTEINYNHEKKESFTIDFTMYLDNYLYLELPISKDKDNKLSMGMSIEKTFDLSNFKRNLQNKQVDSSWIYGKVYLDSNNNGEYDLEEVVLPNVVLIVDGQRVVSDLNGDYFISGLLPLEKYKIEVDRKSIDPMLTQKDIKKRIETRASIGTKYNVAVQAVSMITGNVLPGEGLSDQELVRILSMTTVLLEKNGKIQQEIDPEFDGMFFFENVLPGKYEIKFNYLGSDNIEFSHKKIDLNISLVSPDEGEYFEGYDVVVSKGIEIDKEETEEENNESYDLEDILNSF